jgi:hypothetical protein
VIIQNLALSKRTCYEPLASTHPDRQGNAETVSPRSAANASKMKRSSDETRKQTGLESLDMPPPGAARSHWYTYIRRLHVYTYTLSDAIESDPLPPKLIPSGSLCHLN